MSINYTEAFRNRVEDAPLNITESNFWWVELKNP